MISVGGLACSEAVLSVPRMGTWSLDAMLDDDSGLTGKIAINLDGHLTLNGFVVRSDVSVSRTRIRAVGGAGGMNKVANPKFYRGTAVTRGAVVNDLLRDAGETLSGTSDAPTLGSPLQAWTTLGVPTYLVLANLVGPAKATWRVLVDGTHYIGPETWPDSGIDYDLVNYDPEHGVIVIATELPLLQPGTLLSGNKVDHVESRLTGDGCRSTAWIVT